jgi:hypothetical protein
MTKNKMPDESVPDLIRDPKIWSTTGTVTPAKLVLAKAGSGERRAGVSEEAHYKIGR